MVKLRDVTAEYSAAFRIGWEERGDEDVARIVALMNKTHDAFMRRTLRIVLELIADQPAPARELTGLDERAS